MTKRDAGDPLPPPETDRMGAYESDDRHSEPFGLAQDKLREEPSRSRYEVGSRGIRPFADAQGDRGPVMLSALPALTGAKHLAPRERREFVVGHRSEAR